MRLNEFVSLALTLALLPRTADPSSSLDTNRVTILYDAFGNRPGLTRDWGFAALVEYGGKRILFDTGNNADVFARNVRALGVDLRRLDFVVVSHRHGDHTAGLNYLLRSQSAGEDLCTSGRVRRLRCGTPRHLLSSRFYATGFDAVLRRGLAGRVEVRHALAERQFQLGGQSDRSGSGNRDHLDHLDKPQERWSCMSSPW